MGLTDPIVHVRQAVLGFIELLGEFSFFMGEAFGSLRRQGLRWMLFFRHCEFIGASSLGIVSVAAIFVGGVMGFQLYASLHLFAAESLLGGSIGVSVFRELGPVMAAVMVTGRAGAAIAAEIATMRITEQVDALEVMGVDPIGYLVTPRVLAGLLMMPLVAMYFSVVSTLAGAFVSCDVMGLQYSIYWSQFTKVVDRIEIIHCLVKGAFFGLVLTGIACFCGFRTQGGARSVGLATRSSVVAGCLTILLADYILTSLLPWGWPVLVAE